MARADQSPRVQALTCPLPCDRVAPGDVSHLAHLQTCDTAVWVDGGSQQPRSVICELDGYGTPSSLALHDARTLSIKDRGIYCWSEIG